MFNVWRSLHRSNQQNNRSTDQRDRFSVENFQYKFHIYTRRVFSNTYTTVNTYTKQPQSKYDLATKTQESTGKSMMQRPVRDMWPVPRRKANDFNFNHKNKLSTSYIKILMLELSHHYNDDFS